MNRLMNLVGKLHNDDSGAAFIEYTVLLGVILAVGVAAVASMGTWANGKWTTLRADVGP